MKYILMLEHVQNNDKQVASIRDLQNPDNDAYDNDDNDDNDKIETKIWPSTGHTSWLPQHLCTFNIRTPDERQTGQYL